MARKVSTVVAVIVVVLGLVLYINQRNSKSPAPSATPQTFTVERTTVITQEAGTVTLRFSPLLKVVLGAKANTDKGYFSLKCQGRSRLVSVPGNGRWISTACRLTEVHYSDNSANTGTIILKPKR